MRAMLEEVQSAVEHCILRHCLLTRSDIGVANIKDSSNHEQR